ncbi:tRNA (guanine-N(7)-)-methyltransferase non-catalytic subunit trm82 [Zalerion maritima]|uniref:tRNA (Guanine-N(7)-)-methyltransferase non-catalytic subunit trm82 n=1 Tax=Zalerion maritima TaxID=339359 RepID=A0AAD5RWH6_9PEZI|nr:tRNA (guanine-N(7)-)-methyltransferase non-catalytic subunit trm82 [Zalerion maritima]
MTGNAPYQCIQVCGRFLFAAQGANIHSFSLENGNYLSTWKHLVPGTTDDETPAVDALGDFEACAPPTKRRKIGESPDEQTENGESKNSKSKSKSKPQSTYMIPDQPLINLLVSTLDGKFLVAVTSHDKVIRVFEHDGEGAIEQISQRTMPKRPCSILITPDGKAIMSADKFGDVYSLPLIDATESTTPTAVQSRRTTTPTLAEAKIAAAPAKTDIQYKTAATPLTVHTARNRVALENQMMHQASPTQKISKDPSILSFAHTLLLGHVSLLTAISLARDSRGRAYILSADRDEHIRVSRGPPQSHVIDTFCLGHKDFVSRLCVPENKPELLVSGGGDEEIFLWDWLNGRILARENILRRAKEVIPNIGKVAVSGLVSAFQDRHNTTVLSVTCEKIPAIFIYEIKEPCHFEFKTTIQLAGNPLDVYFLPADPRRLVVSLDMMDCLDAAPDVLQVIGLTPESDHAYPSPKIQTNKAPDTQTLPKDDIRKLIYTNEHLRKYEGEVADQGA